jgi:predicted nucleotidyltransferase
VTDFGRLLADLNDAAVRYVVIGGIAVVRHGVVRATRDVDVVIARSDVHRLRELSERWQATRPDGSPLNSDDFVPERSIHLKTPHGFLDVMPDGRPVAFEELEARADTRRVDGTPAPICSLADLVALKRVAGRGRDLLDLDELETAHGELPDSRG